MKEKSILFFFIFSIIFFDRPCFAYLDPGTGSYIIQVIIALMVGAAISIKMFWKRIVSFLSIEILW